MRLPIIRHIRYLWHRVQVVRWALLWRSAGIGLGYPNQSDIDHLNKIWKGEA